MKFTYNYTASEPKTSKLLNYVRKGVLIRSDPNYEKSPLGLLEKFVQNKAAAIKSYLGEKSILNRDENLEKMFYAIVAPSMEGKTQSSFVFRTLRSLYFVLMQSSLSDFDSTQEIYKNFNVLSAKMRQFAILDLSLIEHKNRNANVSRSIYDQVGVTELTDFHGDTKFLVLGFIFALIEHANTNFKDSGKEWMEFYAISPKNFKIQGMSINEMRQFDLGNYILFFDEFEGLGWTVLVRNFAKASNIPFFVANTNTNAANFVGKFQSSRHSRCDDAFAWCLVVNRLNSMSVKILDSVLPGIDHKFNEIIKNSEFEYEKRLLYGFFDDFIVNQLKHLRPGFADIICSNLLEIPSALGISLNSVLETMVNPLINEIRKTKPQMYSELDGILGSLALYMNNAYLSSDETELTNIFHRKAYLQDHFYYIVNPVDNSKCCFLTYPPSGEVSTEIDQEQAQTQEEQIPILMDKPLRLVKDTCGKSGNPSGFSDWDTEFTYFKPEEIIPFLACQVVIDQKSIPALLKLGIAKINSSSDGTGNTQNLSQSVPLSWNELEVLSSVCIIESSHHSVGAFTSTFYGQNGESFLTNLVENLIESNGFRYKNCTVVNFHARTFGLVLERIHIPFLFPAGMKLPTFFKEHLSDANGFNERSVNFGEYERTINGDEIFNFQVFC